MENICLIIDFDGFQLRQRPFMAREMGYVAMDVEEVDVVSFDLSGVSLEDERDRKTVWYCRKFLHGLPFHPRRKERCHQPEYLDELLRQLYEHYSTNEKNLVAYKGGICERDRLEELGIPSVNLEEHGCPKYDVLKNFYPKVQGNCWRHDVSSGGRAYHCVAAEVQTFKAWVTDKLRAADQHSLGLRVASQRRLHEISRAMA